MLVGLTPAGCSELAQSGEKHAVSEIVWSATDALLVPTNTLKLNESSADGCWTALHKVQVALPGCRC